MTQTTPKINKKKQKQKQLIEPKNDPNNPKK